MDYYECVSQCVQINVLQCNNVICIPYKTCKSTSQVFLCTLHRTELCDSFVNQIVVGCSVKIYFEVKSK